MIPGFVDVMLAPEEVVERVGRIDPSSGAFVPDADPQTMRVDMLTVGDVLSYRNREWWVSHRFDGCALIWPMPSRMPDAAAETIPF